MIKVDVATLPERLREFAKFATEMAIVGKQTAPKDLARQDDSFFKLSTTASALAIEFAVATKGAADEATAGLAQASRAAAMLYTDAASVANSGVGRINNVYINGVGEGAAKQAIVAAKWLEDNPPALLQFGTELVKTGSKSGKTIDVSAATGQIFGALARGSQDSVVVSGRSGSGRSVVLNDLAVKLADGLAPANVRDARVIGLDVQRFRADTADPVKLAQRLKETLDNAYEFDQQGIVVIDDFDLLQDSIDASLITRNAIQDSKGKLRVVAFTSDEKAPFALDDKGLKRYAQHVKLPDTSLDRAQDILATKWEEIELDTGVAPVGENVTRAVATLAESYLGGRKRDLAGLSVDVARGAAGRVASEMFSKPPSIIAAEGRVADLEKQVARYATKTSDIAKQRLATSRGELESATKELATLNAQWKTELPIVQRLTTAERSVTKLRAGGVADGDEQMVAAVAARDAARSELDTLRGGKPGIIADRLDIDSVIRYVSEESGVPVESISWDASEKFRNMLPTLQKDLVGQDHLLEAFTAPVQTWKAGGKDPDRAVAVIAIGGPSQVGKTEGAYVLNEFLTGKRESLDVIVGGAYTDPSMRNSLVGAPSGYKDAEVGGALTKPAQERGHGVTLWDEANKTHPDLFDTLLQIGNSGEVADGMGRPVSFRNRVVLVAGNWLRDEVDAARMDWGKLTDAQKAEWKAKLRGAMEAQGIKPEVLNRFTDFVVVNSVNDRMVRGVAGIYLDKVTKQLARQGIELQVKPEVIEHLVTKANVPGQGGSLIKKVITQEVKDVVMSKKINGEIATDDIVTVGMKTVDGEPKISLDVTKL